MQYWSSWLNLHPAAIETLQTWGDVDYGQEATLQNVPLLPKDKLKFDDIDVLQKTSMYPGVWKKDTQTEEFQVRVLNRVFQLHLRRRPPKAIGRTEVVEVIKHMSQRDGASAILQTLLDDVEGSVSSKMITEVDAAQVKGQATSMMAAIQKGKYDGKLKTVSAAQEYPHYIIAQLHKRLETIKELVHNRREAERKRKRQAEEVSLSTVLYVLGLKKYIVMCLG